MWDGFDDVGAMESSPVLVTIYESAEDSAETAVEVSLEPTAAADS